MMERLTVTPHGSRPVTAALIAQAQAMQSAPQTPYFAKWELFNDLCAARWAYGLTDRDLAVLNALLTFHKGDGLNSNENLIVFPSNASLSERAHGMAESTLRRHLAALVRSGVIARHDSPNGKRYATRGAGGALERAFGFDLTPLLHQARDITAAAQEARAAAARMKREREELTLLKRDAIKLLAYAVEEGASGPWKEIELQLLSIHKASRRQLDANALAAVMRELRGVVDKIKRALVQSEEMDGNDVKCERHYQNSKTHSIDLESALEKDGAETEPPSPAHSPEPPRLPLSLVVKACPDIEPYFGDSIRHWHQLVAAASLVRGMMGISADAWENAQRSMGPETAAITVAGILQRVESIKSPGGYLRSLTDKAKAGAFSPGPMIMALLSS